MVSRIAARALSKLHAWAESGWAGPAVGLWGLLQSSIVPGPSDALLAPLGLADPRRVYRLAAWATVSAILGGLLIYLIASNAADDSLQRLLALIGIGESSVARITTAFRRHGWLLVFFGAFGPISTKLTCVVAGMMGMPLPLFAISLGAGRALRFFAVAAIIHAGGERLQQWLRTRAARPPRTNAGGSVSRSAGGV